MRFPHRVCQAKFWTNITAVVYLSTKARFGPWYNTLMIRKKLLKYTVIYTSEPEGGFTVTVPSLPGCVTYGKDLKEAEKMAEDAIKLYLESLKAHKESIPSDSKSFIGSIDLEFPSIHA